MSDTLLLEDVEVKEKEDKGNILVLFNDDHNTVDHVINCLINICKHDPLQAEQCTMIVHFKGKCDVKSGGLEEMQKLATLLGEEDLTCEVQ